MHGMPETVRATPPRCSICGWIALAHRLDVRTRKCARQGALAPWRGSARKQSLLTESTNTLCFLCVLFSLHPCNWGSLLSISLLSLLGILYSDLLCSELLMRVLTRTEHHDWTRLSVQAPSRKVSTSVRHRRGRQLATLRTMSGTMQSHLLAALSCLR